jgi:thioredoxin 1
MNPSQSHDPSAIETLTRATFARQVLDARAPIAVEFMSYGCAHCRTIEPVLQQAARAIAAEEQVFRVNVALEQNLAAEYGVEGTPTLIMFRAGKEVGRAEGPSPTLASVMSALTSPFRT